MQILAGQKSIVSAGDHFRFSCTACGKYAPSPLSRPPTRHVPSAPPTRRGCVYGTIGLSRCSRSCTWWRRWRWLWGDASSFSGQVLHAIVLGARGARPARPVPPVTRAQSRATARPRRRIIPRLLPPNHRLAVADVRPPRPPITTAATTWCAHQADPESGGEKLRPRRTSQLLSRYAHAFSQEMGLYATRHGEEVQAPVLMLRGRRADFAAASSTTAGGGDDNDEGRAGHGERDGTTAATKSPRGKATAAKQGWCHFAYPETAGASGGAPIRSFAEYIQLRAEGKVTDAGTHTAQRPPPPSTQHSSDRPLTDCTTFVCCVSYRIVSHRDMCVPWGQTCRAGCGAGWVLSTCPSPAAASPWVSSGPAPSKRVRAPPPPPTISLA